MIPFGRFLPDFQALQVQTQPSHTVPEVRPPTIRDLLRHTSGLSYRFMNAPGIVEAYEWLGVDDGLAAPDLQGPRMKPIYASDRSEICSEIPPFAGFCRVSAPVTSPKVPQA
jgi:CubicO group peptidase (beta-lactamase class C family)